MLEMNENPKWIAEMLGHSDFQMLFKIYGIAIPPKPEEPLRHAIPSTGVKFPIMMLNIRWNCYNWYKPDEGRQAGSKFQSFVAKWWPS